MKETSIIALDVGRSRVGVARANSVNGFPSPLMTLNFDKDFWINFQDIVREEKAELVVVGLPRSLSGNDTEQTEYTLNFINELKIKTGIPVEVQSEDLTTVKAYEEISSKKRFNYDKDSLAATYILEDYLSSIRGK